MRGFSHLHDLLKIGQIREREVEVDGLKLRLEAAKERESLLSFALSAAEQGNSQKRLPAVSNVSSVDKKLSRQLKELEQRAFATVFKSALIDAGKTEAEVDALVDYSVQLAHAIRTCAVKRAFHSKRNAKLAKKAVQKATNAAKQKVRSQAISKDKKKKSALSLLSSMAPAELAALLAQQQQQQQQLAQ